MMHPPYMQVGGLAYSSMFDVLLYSYGVVILLIPLALSETKHPHHQPQEQEPLPPDACFPIPLHFL